MFSKKQKKGARLATIKQEDRSSNYSYYSSRTIKNDPRRSTKPDEDLPENIVMRTKQSQPKRIYPLLILVVIIIFLGFILYLNNSVSINVESSGNNNFLQNNSVYQQNAENFLSHSIANNIKLTLDNNGLTNEILNKFPEISTAKVSIPLLTHSITLNISESTPVAILQDSHKNYFLIKNNGVAMAMVSSKNSSIFIASKPYIIDSFSSVHINNQALSNSDLAFISYVYNELAAQSIKVSSFTLVPNSRELDVRLSGANYFVKFNLEQSVKVQVGSYLALRGYLQSNNKSVSQYIDVRVVGRAYYK